MKAVLTRQIGWHAEVYGQTRAMMDTLLGIEGIPLEMQRDFYWAWSYDRTLNIPESSRYRLRALAAQIQGVLYHHLEARRLIRYPRKSW